MIGILITGATGNVGGELIKIFSREAVGGAVAAVSNFAKDANRFPADIERREFDFTRPETFAAAMRGVDKVFLMRPPAISNVRRDIFPFLAYCRRANVKKIVLLSLLGAEKLWFTPHRKIELEILRLGLPYTFLRSSFFMQNLSTTHRDEIKNESEIFVPAGKGKTSFVDARDVAEVAFFSLFGAEHSNKAYQLTGNADLSYYEVAEILSRALGKHISYRDPSLASFIWRTWRSHRNLPFALVTAIIYTTARLGRAGLVTGDLGKILRRQPTSFQEFAKDYKECWL
ncbi:MAG: SDR family oxidoreductase [Pyrinomonadaceae bacterium]|nr:SDR family oxidoreductase [Pyrinomonadaceae bacterium]